MEGVDEAISWLGRGDGSTSCLSVSYSAAEFVTDMFDVVFFFAFFHVCWGLADRYSRVISSMTRSLRRLEI